MSLLQQLKGAAIGAYLAPQARTLERQLARGKRLLTRAPRAITFYFQADDPASYLVAQVLHRVRERHGIPVRVLVVPPPETDAAPEPERRARYLLRESRELSQFYQVDFPDRDSYPRPEEIRRANAILLSNPRDVLSATVAIAKALWHDDEQSLAAAAAQHGQVGDSEIDDALRAAYEQLRARGHYQGGTCELDGTWASGVDRIHYIEELLGNERDSALQLRPESDWPADGDQFGVPPGSELTVELFFSFRSPYSYLALARSIRLTKTYPVHLLVRPLLPMVMRGLPVPRVKRFYLVKDAKREADRLGIPFGRICDPLGAGVERSLAIFHHAEANGQALPFLLSASEGIWAEASTLR